MDDAPAHAAPEFLVTTDAPRPGVLLLSVRGDADLHTAPELRERLSSAIDEGPTAIVLDLAETTFLDSMSLGVLLGVASTQPLHRAELRLVVTRPDIRRIFEITLLDRVFPVDASREDALRALSDGVVEGRADRDH
jgi:anti-sigma B factor antagonist